MVQRIKIIPGDNPALTTATIANVVTAPAMEP